MRILLVIATILLVVEYSNLAQLFTLTDSEAIVLCYDCESEEEKKTEKEPRKFDKLNYYFVYAGFIPSLQRQKRSSHKAGLCLKGHCALIDQPPKM